MTLMEQYKTEIVPELRKKRNYKNIFQVPKITKIVLSTGIGSSKGKDVFTEASTLFADITGQKPVVTKARVSVSNFKLREGSPVGVVVTLRGKRMYDFLHKLVNIGFPRVRDFRGISPKAFDGFGNYSVGISEQSIFTEVNMDKVKNTIGMNVTIVTTANTDDEARELLTMLKLPFSK